VYTAALAANLKEPGRLEALQAMMRASKAASAERVGNISAPTLVIMGGKDPDFPNPQAEAQWVAEAAHGRYTMVDGAGHYPHAEMPEATAPLMTAFLQTVQAVHHVA
jgi:pimeloyl-ACP methyl ester carboxylesterase